MNGRRRNRTVSRHSGGAFVRGDAEHLWRTWHPQTRPASATVDDVPWTGLEVLEVQDGGPDQSDGVVEFIAHYREPDGTPGSMRERSRFTVRAGRWFYLDGEVPGPAGNAY